MKRKILASIFYNLSFYGLTGIACFLCLPALLLPRKYAMGVVYGFIYTNLFLERAILGLNYEVRGREHLPEDGSYIVASKHQSAYETMKLHILFKDPAIILKKELLSIPLWGWYLKKSDVIAIDRSTPDAAIQSIQDGARHMKEAGRPIVIFPQGTRVHVDTTTKEKPYKVGVARIQEATELPVIPLAMNSGMFWPRNGFFKSGGTAIFEFLEPIPDGLSRSELLTKLEKDIEETSLSLMNEAKEKNAEKSGKGWLLSFAVIAVLLVSGYSFLWHAVAGRVQEEYVAYLTQISDGEKTYLKPGITGFPGKLTLNVEKESIPNRTGMLEIENLFIQGWPLPFLPITIKTGELTFLSKRWLDALYFDSFEGEITPRGRIIDIADAHLQKENFSATVTGTVEITDAAFPVLDTVINLENHEILIDELRRMGVLDDRMSLFLGSGLTALRDVETGIVSVPFYQRQDTLFAGPIPVYKFPPAQPRRQRRLKPVIPDPVSPDASVRDSGNLPAQAP